MEMDKDLHPGSRKGFARSGELYDRARSEYPDAVVERLFKHLGLKPGARVLELASGTGKFTEKLLRAGVELTVVEPSAEMRSVLARRASPLLVVDAIAEALPFPSEFYDFVFAATSYHWFDPTAAYTEILRVLKPGGGLGLLWTSWQQEMQPEWYMSIRKLMTPFEAGTPRYKHMKWREPFDREIDFKFLQFERHDISRPVTIAEICERMLSVSYIAALPDLVFLALKREMEEMLKERIVQGQGFKMPEEIHLYWTHKEATATP